jgi:prophage endopeptidase
MSERLKLGLAAIIAVILLGTGFAAAWFWQANSFKAELATQASNHAADLTAIANAGATQARTALESQQKAEQALAALDTKRTREKADALAENERLRRAVADGYDRLRVAGRCSTATGSVPQTAGGASMGDAGTVELAPAAGRNIFDIRAGIIADQAALKALQDYVQNVCR